MTEPLFFKSPSGLTVRQIGERRGAEARSGTRLDHLITNIAPLDRAGPNDLAFLDSAKYADGLISTCAGACLMTERFATQAPGHLNVLRAQEPYRAFVTVARKLYPDALRPSSFFGSKGVTPGAIVHPSAQIEGGVSIDPGAVIGPRAAIGAGSVIGSTAALSPV